MSTGLDFMGVVNRMLVPQAVQHCLVFRIVFGDIFRRPVCVWPRNLSKRFRTSSIT